MLDSLKGYKTNSYNSYLDRSDFSFLGYGKHAPNTDAVCFLIREIWPQIRQRIPDSKLNIYGKDYPKEIQSLQDLQKGIGIHGWIEASDSVLAGTRLNLAPLRFGAGLKGKIVHAIEQGTPTVTTKIGAEGIWPSTGFDSLVADDPKEFAAKAFQIYTNEALWLKSLRSGQAFLAKELDRQTHDQRLHSRVEELRSRLGAHRTGNVLGRILQYQGHQSTRYMAKWIEAKNQS